jgi:hypothetical protein
MARGKFGLSQSFRGGSQYFFSGRTLVSGNETPELFQNNSPKSEGHSVTFAESNAMSNASAKTTGRNVLSVGREIFSQAVNKSAQRAKSSASSLSQTVQTFKNVAYRRAYSAILFQVSTVGALLVRISDAFRPAFEENSKSEAFTEFPELWTMQEMTTTTYTTETSSINFQDDGVSSYEDGERYPAN